jgi:hypothetical protein
VTACDEKQRKLNMPLFRLLIVITFVQGNPIQPLNSLGENRLSSIGLEVRKN